MTASGRVGLGRAGQQLVARTGAAGELLPVGGADCRHLTALPSRAAAGTKQLLLAMMLFACE